MDESAELLCVSQVRGAPGEPRRPLRGLLTRRVRAVHAVLQAEGYVRRHLRPLHSALTRGAGNKPDFAHAMPPAAAREAYAALLARLRSAYRPEAVQDGVFGAMMQVELVNDGPVTVVLDSQSKE